MKRSSETTIQTFHSYGDKEQYFNIYLGNILYIHTFIGCNFLNGFGGDLSRLSVVRIGFKTFYGLITLIATMAISMSMLIPKGLQIVLSDLVPIVNVAVAESAIAVCKLTLFWKAKDVLNLIRLCAEYEKSEEWPSKPRMLLFISLGIIIIHVGIFVDCLIISIMKTEELISEFQSWFSINPSISGPILATLYFLQDFFVTSCYIVTPSLIVYCCVYLNICFKKLSTRLSYIRKSNINQPIRHLEEVKDRYFKLLQISKILDDCFCIELFRIFIAYGSICCISAYYMVTINQNLETRINHIMKFLFMFLSMLLPAYTTTQMSDTAFSLFDDLHQFSFQLPRDERQTIVSLMLMCQNQRPTLTGWNFFDINLDLIVSITATIITYTVILVQSN